MENTRVYELLIVFKLNVALAQIEKIIKEFAVQKQILEVDNIEYLGLRSLPIHNRKYERSHFICIQYKNHPSLQKSFTHKLKLREDILRFLVIRRDNIRTSPSHLHKSDYPMFKYNYTTDTNPQEIYYHNIEYLKRFTTERGRILSAKINHLSSRDQNHVAREIKLARSAGLVSFMNE